MNVDCSDLTTRKISTPTKHAQRTVFTNKTWPKSGQNPLRIWRSATASAQLCKSVDLYSTKRKLTNVQYRHLPCEYRTDSHQTACAHAPSARLAAPMASLQWMPKPHRKQRWPTNLAYNPRRDGEVFETHCIPVCANGFRAVAHCDCGGGLGCTRCYRQAFRPSVRARAACGPRGRHLRYPGSSYGVLLA